jgi:hypothetical protein
MEIPKKVLLVVPLSVVDGATRPFRRRMVQYTHTKMFMLDRMLPNLSYTIAGFTMFDE